MARTEVKEHRKFKRLVRMLDVPPVVAMGLLEFLWQSAAHACTDFIGDKDDVEAACEWPYEKGRLWPVLKEIGWIDEQEQDRFFVHDYWDHCPEYIKLRLTRRGYGPRATRTTNVHERARNTTNVASTQHNTTQQDTTQPNTEESEKKAKKPKSCPLFDAFWEAYPNKVDPDNCLRKWLARDLGKIAPQIMSSLAAFKASEKWRDQNGKYIPMSTTWINQSRWLSSPTPTVQPPKAEARDW
jgi:hypothetical protein